MANRSRSSSPILISDSEVEEVQEENNETNEAQKENEEEINELEHLRKLFVGGLTINTTEKMLENHFEKFGKIVDAIVLIDPKTKRSKGYGFVTFSKVYMLQKAQESRPHTIDGKTVDTKHAVARLHRNKMENTSNSKNLFVGGIKNHIDENSLTEYFEKFGKILKVKIVKNRETGQRRGYAYIEFEDYDSADKAILYPPHTIKDVVVEVKKAVKNLNGRTAGNMANVRSNGQQMHPNTNLNYPQQPPQGYLQQPPSNWINYPQTNTPWNGGPPFQGPWNQGWGNFFPMQNGPMNQFGPQPGFSNPQLGFQIPPQQNFQPPQSSNANFKQNQEYQQNFNGGNNFNKNSMPNNNTSNLQQHTNQNQNSSNFNVQNKYGAGNNVNSNLKSGIQSGSSVNQNPLSIIPKSNVAPITNSTENIASNTQTNFQHQNQTYQNNNVNSALSIRNNPSNVFNKSPRINSASTSNFSKGNYQGNDSVSQKRQSVVDEAFEKNFQKYILGGQANQSSFGSGYQQNIGGGVIRSNFQNSNRTSPFQKPPTKDYEDDSKPEDILQIIAKERKNYERLSKNFDLKKSFADYIKMKDIFGRNKSS